VLNHRVPIIALTAMAMQGDRERCVAAGMDDYLTKPLHPENLARALERWLPQAEVGGHAESAAQQRADSSAENAPAVTEEEIPVFKQAELLNRLIDDRELALEIVAAFLTDIPLQIEKLNQFLAEANISGLMRQAHTIKGAAANLAAVALSQAGGRVEAACKAGDIHTAGNLAPNIQLEFNRLKQVLIDWDGSNPIA
jgi:HPt (histidine-containing phosphotransfer) domain-containing protein